MLEEYHADNNGAKQLYGWGTINANVWLPSYSELVGCNMDTYLEEFGTSKGLMVDIVEANVWQHVNPDGGAQFACLAQFNETGGGTYIWQLCAQQWSWLRSSSYRGANTAWSVRDSSRVNDRPVTDSNAVHPAVLSAQIAYRLLSPERQGERSRAYPR